MAELIKEKSCGAVVYKLDEKGRLRFLIIKQKTGHFGFPKGHVEKNETEAETAMREVKEETNIDVDINTGFRVVSTYYPAKGVLKDVIFFLATPKTDNPIAQPEEVAEVHWCSYFNAKQLLTHRQNRNILRNAIVYIKKNRLTKNK